MGTQNSYTIFYGEAGRMGPGGKKMGTQNSYTIFYDEAGRICPVVKR
jgi:hypothetical protein